MDHPNAIYFGIASYLFMTVMGAFLLLGAFGSGPFGATAEAPRVSKFLSSRAVKAIIGLLGLLMGGFATVVHLMTLISR